MVSARYQDSMWACSVLSSSDQSRREASTVPASWYRALTALRRELGWSQRTAWPQIDEADDVVTVTYEDIVVVTNLSGRPRPAAELSDVLLSWAPVGSDPSCLPAGQTLVARR